MNPVFRLILGAAIAVAIAAGTLGPASAANPPARPAPPAGPAGYEIRAVMHGQYEVWEHHLWRFGANGRVTGHLFAQQIGFTQNGIVQESDTGRWRLVGDSMCVTWKRWFDGREHCYRLRVLNGRRFYFQNTNGRLSFEGTYRRIGL